jgi:hypothetical protein
MLTDPLYSPSDRLEPTLCYIDFVIIDLPAPIAARAGAIYGKNVDMIGATASKIGEPT